ncbi:MAG: TIGR01906 family membrane protein [Chloroflexi bacterium]|jgi:integral membrane protein (TIGR01906 family)|nr:TIGR01906 family membrane protein [Chloroflexota bacterium]
MRIPGWLLSISRTVLVLAMPLVLLFSPLYLFATPGFVRHEYSLRDFPPSERFAPEERLRISDTILHYLRNKATLADMSEETTDSGEIALLPSEVQHLVDVKVVMDGIFAAHAVAVGLGLVAALLLWFSPRRHWLPTALRQGVWLMGGIIAFILVFSFIDFDVFFTRFHQIFFQPGTWVFYETDTLIQLYPLPFWMDAVWKIGVTTLVLSGLVYLLAHLLDRSPAVAAAAAPATLDSDTPR